MGRAMKLCIKIWHGCSGVTDESSFVGPIIHLVWQGYLVFWGILFESNMIFFIANSRKLYSEIK